MDIAKFGSFVRNSLELANVKTEKLRDLDAETQVDILGKTKRWFHLHVNDTLQGFMHESLVKEIE